MNPISGTNPITPAPPAATQPLSASTKDLANQNVFLQLLVAQLKNQDPSSPADGTQFITQLAQFSELSNSTQMTGDIFAIRQALAQAQASQAAGQTGATNS